jgi:LmbE family N-acetylglucosaminyl deacetylase
MRRCAYAEDLTFLAGQVAASIRQVGAEAVLTHGSNGEYGHPAHVLSHQAARIAVESFGERARLLYTAAAFFPEHPRPRLANKDDPADLVLGISPALPEKTRAALCHRTQHALFTRLASEEAGRPLSVPEVILTLEGLRRAFPAVESGVLDDEFTRILKPWVVERET